MNRPGIDQFTLDIDDLNAIGKGELRRLRSPLKVRTTASQRYDQKHKGSSAEEEPYEHAISHFMDLLAVVFRVEQIGQSRAAVGAIAIGIVFPPLGVFSERLVTQADFALGRTQLDDFELDLFAQLETRSRRSGDRHLELRHVTQPFDPFVHFDEHSEWRMPHDPAANQYRPRRELAKNCSQISGCSCLIPSDRR